MAWNATPMSDLDHSVDPADEGRHEPGPEQWWNESWYLDYVAGDDEFSVNCRGQRDHSWANRDWWSFEWCWFAGWLDDGTRIHGADIRLSPDFRLSFGYRQAKGQVIPIESELATSEDTAAFGM